MNSIRLVLSLAALHNWEFHQMDVKSAFYMVIYRRKFTWNNLLDMFRITLALSVSLRNPYMALSKLLELGMPKWIKFLLDTGFSETISSYLFFMLMILSILVVTLNL